MKYATEYHLFPLGDSALTVDFGNIIDEEINGNVMALYQQLLNNPIDGTIEIVPAYSLQRKVLSRCPLRSPAIQTEWDTG
jgi:hypothetical protein